MVSSTRAQALIDAGYYVAPGSLAELMTMTPEPYRPELRTAAAIEQHLAELDGRWFSEDNAVFGIAHELAARLADAERRAWWHAHITQRWHDLQAEYARRREESLRFETEYNARQKAERRAQRKAERQAPKQATAAPTPEPTQPPPPAQTAPKPRPNRAQNTTPVWHQIPAELQARPQWVLWRYEIDPKGRPTKIPYNARTATPASTTAPRTWATFANAKAAYLARPDYFAGIGYVFSKDDPYCGADFDHCLENCTPTEWAAAHIAALRSAGAYIEVSVSGSGVHAITRATVGKGRKTPRGEVYDRGRFFTISGQALEPTAIADGQAAIDALRTALAGAGHSSTPKALRDGTAGTGDRAAALAEHTPAEWEAARDLLRTKRDLLIKRSQLATQKEETQGYFAARLLWPELHQRWPHIGVYRADGTLDDSQARAVLARTLYGRGFTFPQFVVIMSHHFAAYCLAKWGAKERWREELAALWQDAIENTPYAPKAPTGKRAPDVAISAKLRGRASNHAQQVERVYQLLQDARAGAQALINTAELAGAADMHRVTLAGILAELRSADRITTQRNGRYGGLIVTFSDVAIVCEQPAESSAVMLETPIELATPLEETSTSNQTCVSSELREVDYSLLAELATAYLDNPEAGAVALRTRATGESTRRHSAKHFAHLVREQYGEHYTADEARAAYKAEQTRRAALEKAEWARFFAQLKAMATPDLIAYIHGGCRRELAELARKNESAAIFDTHKYRTRLKCAKQHLAWRGVALPAKPTKSTPYTPTKPQRPRAAPKARPMACEPLRFEQPMLTKQPHANSLADRLRALKAQRQQERL